MAFVNTAVGRFLAEEDMNKKSMFDIETVNVKSKQYDILTVTSKVGKKCIELSKTLLGKTKVSLKTLTKPNPTAGYDFTGCTHLQSIKEDSEADLLSADASQIHMKLLCPSLVDAEGSCTLTTDKDPEQTFLLKTVVTIALGDKTKGQKHAMEQAVVSPDTGLCLSIGVSKENNIFYDLSDSLCAPAYALHWASREGKLRDFNDNKATLKCRLFPEKELFLRKLKEALNNPNEDGKKELLVHPIILSNGITVSKRPVETREHYSNYAAQALLDVLPSFEKQVADADVPVEQWKTALRDIIKCPIDLQGHATNMVVGSDGHTYYKKNILQVTKSPMTREPFDPTKVIQNQLVMKVYKLVEKP